jgi:ankyrin repeat protein
VDFLVRTHGLGLPHPAPLEADPIFCFHIFGSLVWFTTRFDVPWHAPSLPLRTNSLLHIAIVRRDTDVAQQQLDRGVPIDVLGRDGLSPLHWSLHSPLAGTDSDMSSWLLDRGADVDVRSAQGATPLMNAVQERNLDKVGLLIDRGADPNAQDHRGFTALHRAAESGQSDVVNALLDRGADPGIVAANGQAAASLAAAQGHEAIAELLSRTRDS